MLDRGEYCLLGDGRQSFMQKLNIQLTDPLPLIVKLELSGVGEFPYYRGFNILAAKNLN